MEAKHEQVPATTSSYCKTLAADAHRRWRIRATRARSRALLEAARLGLIAPILVGPRERIEAVAARGGAATRPASAIVDAPHSHAAAETAVRHWCARARPKR